MTNILQDSDPFLQAAKRTPVDLEAWAVSLMERHNRKSHLAPKLSPASKNFLREGGSSSGTNSSANDLPIGSLSINSSDSRQTASRPFPTRSTSATMTPDSQGSGSSNRMGMQLPGRSNGLNGQEFSSSSSSSKDSRRQGSANYMI